MCKRLYSFNPSVGILGGHTCAAMIVKFVGSRVSIPQSGFLVVTRDPPDTSLNIRDCFNPSVGILGGHTSATLILFLVSRIGFNPSVGILGGHTKTLHNDDSMQTSFNPSVGILGGHTLLLRYWGWVDLTSFNPSVGILGGHTTNAFVSTWHYDGVSIPQSGFLVVTPNLFQNPIRTLLLFQSLSRDSWWSH